LTASERRKKILSLLKSEERPVAAKDLASKFGVSRQIIVQDMTVIRASEPGILSTNRGYIMQSEKVCSREFKVRHGADRLEEEFNIYVDCGGIIKNESISHRIYGRITAELDIRSRQDVSDFIERMENSKSTLLGNATSDYHYHMVEAANEERLDLIEKKLNENGFLVPLLPWEQKKDDNAN